MTHPPTPAGWYPDPGGSGGERYWDGSGWTTQCRRSSPKHRKTLWVWIAAACIAILVVVVGVVVWRVNRSSEVDRWTAFPHTSACHVTARDPGPNWIDVPPSLLVKQVTMTHPGGQRLQLEIEFAQLTPQAAGFSYGILVMSSDPKDDSVLTIDSPQGGQPWKADASTLDHPDRNPLVSVAETRRTVTIEVDLAGQTKLLGRHFTPSVDILIAHPRPDLDFDGQECAWSMSAAEGARKTATAPTAQIPAPTNAPTEAARPPSGTTSCGPDEATAMESALNQLAPEPVTGHSWKRTPVAGNYEPCADLSTILVTVQGGTGSSPVQALMFHRGVYLGTGTLKAYGFTSLNSAASTNDTVVLSYRTGQSCTACNDGTVTNVRFHWDGTKVQMLDPPPPS